MKKPSASDPIESSQLRLERRKIRNFLMLVTAFVVLLHIALGTNMYVLFVNLF